MAIVHKYTIIYFTLIVYNPIAISINRNLCLETFLRFLNDEVSCNFDLITAQDILKDVTTCPTKCNFRMDSLYNHSRYSLRRSSITIGNEKAVFNSCQKSGQEVSHLHVTCSSWNARNLELNESCELTDECMQSLSVCLDGKCKCVNGYSAFDSKLCLKDNVPVGGFCSSDKQCTGSYNSGICENGRCTCKKGFTLIDLACEKDHQNSLGSLISEQHGTNIGITLGTLFGGFILGVIVTAVVATLMYRRLKCRTPNRKEPDVMFVENREDGTADGAQISFTNNKKQNVATLSPYSFAKETQGYNLSSKQEDERTDDVYNHLHEQTEQNDDNYDHACAVTNHITDLSDYSNIRDTATFQTSPSNDGDDYSTLRN